MQKRFQDQVAIVTGGARGIGAAVAKRLSKEGATVILFDLLISEMETTLKSIEKGYAQKVDISNEGEVKTAIQKVVKTYGRLDVLINSAAIIGSTSKKIVDYDFEEFKKVLAINLEGSFLVSKYAIPYMLEKDYGRILLVASIAGKEGNPGMAGYATSKAGVIGLAKALGKEYANTGITINGLAPAVIATEMNLNTDPEMLNYMKQKIPLGRLGTVDEVASLICWIVSPEASFNTGFIFDLSGGRATY